MATAKKKMRIDFEDGGREASWVNPHLSRGLVKTRGKVHPAAHTWAEAWRQEAGCTQQRGLQAEP